MKILPLVESTHPVLREKAKPVDITHPNLRRLVKALCATRKALQGVGIAAPQAGFSLQIIVIDIPQGCHKGPPPKVNGVTKALSELRELVLFNPKIETWGEHTTADEGCLSLKAEGYIPVSRPTSVRIQAMGENGDPFEIETEGFFARVLQHEIDHLKGVLISDYKKTQGNA